MKTVGYIGSALSFLCALSSGANPSPRLEIQRTGDEITVAWTEHGILEASGSTSGPWKEVPNAGSPYKFKATSQVAFFRIKQLFHVLSVTRAGTGTGSVAADPAGIQCGTDCAEPYLQGTVVKLIAIPDPGSQFVGWTGDASGTEPCAVQMDAPRLVTANFVVASPGGLLNGGFEDGPGVGWTQEPGQLIYRADELGVPAYSGKYLAWIGYAQDNRHYAGLRQQVVLPDVWPLYLNFAMLLYSEEICDVGYWDRAGTYANGQPLVENTRVCRGNTGGDGWRKVSLDLSAFAGQTVMLVFEIASGLQDPLASVLLLDDVSISNTPW